jgi:hypothetical protein
MKRLLIPLLSLGVASCASTSGPTPVEKVIYVTNPLQVPTAPILPTWKAVDMQCLSPEMKQKVLERDKTRENYIQELTTVIKSTQK